MSKGGFSGHSSGNRIVLSASRRIHVHPQPVPLQRTTVCFKASLSASCESVNESPILALSTYWNALSTSVPNRMI